LLHARKRFDPTLSVQLNRGFIVHGILHNYVHDPECDGKAAFLVWRNFRITIRTNLSGPLE